ncbi:hypothetical protein EMGBS8_18470 [Verrucomicrobiota bacterium]|nr:hypothetical protein EMGBS8_18470 [Verrucomicrobiota bacterium]
MSQDNNEDDKNGNRVNGRSLMVWVVLIAAVALLVNYSAPSAAHVQKLGVTQVLSYAKEGKLKTLNVKPDPTAGSDSWYQVEGELLVKGEATDDKSRFIAAGRLTEKEFEALRASVPRRTSRSLRPRLA